MTILPEGYHDLPIFAALKLYFGSIQPQVGRANLKFNMYKELYSELYAQMVTDQSNLTDNVVIDREVQKQKQILIYIFRSNGCYHQSKSTLFSAARLRLNILASLTRITLR